MKSVFGLGLLASALVSVASSKPADAATGDSWWSANAATCVATPTSSAYTVSAGTVQVSSGTVVLYCPISRGVLGAGSFDLHIAHKGAKKNTLTEKAYVQAELVVMNRSTGAESVPTGGLFVANGSATYVDEPPPLTLPHISIAFDFNANYYYVRITILSNAFTTGFDQTFYGVSLVEAV